MTAASESPAAGAAQPKAAPPAVTGWELNVQETEHKSRPTEAEGRVALIFTHAEVSAPGAGNSVQGRAALRQAREATHAGAHARLRGDRGIVSRQRAEEEIRARRAELYREIAEFCNVRVAGLIELDHHAKHLAEIR